MTPENKSILDEYLHQFTTLERAFYVRGLSSYVRDRMDKVMREEFDPGYSYCGTCETSVAGMIKKLYRHYYTWLQDHRVGAGQYKDMTEGIIEMNKLPLKVAATFSTSGPIHHFYHIYCDGRWQEPVSEHLKALRESGLYNALASFHIGFVGNRPNQLAVHQYIQSLGFVYVIADEQVSGWEQVTQIPMWQFAQEHDGLMLYAHSKGASDWNDVNIRWRRSMTWHNVWQWRQAAEALATHGAYGCHWIQPLLTGMPEHKVGNWMFAGTFFWTHCELMRNWPRPALTHRHEAEGFVGYGWHQAPFRVYDPTPYFPNTGPFADAWISNPNFSFSQQAKTYE